MVLYPGTYLDEGFLVHVSPDAELVDTQDLDLDQIMARLVEADRGRARGGAAGLRRPVGLLRADRADPPARRRPGSPWDVTPGVPAYAAAAALVGRELTVPLVAQSVVLTRAQARSTAMPAGESLANFAATGATLVVHLAITRTRELMDELAGHYGADCPVVVVHRASQPGAARPARHRRRHRRAGRARRPPPGRGHPRRPRPRPRRPPPSRSSTTPPATGPPSAAPSSAEGLLLVGRTSLTGHFWLADPRNVVRPERPARRTPPAEPAAPVQRT